MERFDDQHDDGQHDVIAFLSKPATYGITEPVERIDTHAAIVFLAGDIACKLKRAVRYPYLDFSTPARRRAVCEAELTLNRRTAPDLYLAVRAVTRRPDGSLGFDDGVPVDWVVMMRRFAPDCLLATLAEKGSLDPGMMRELADSVARFHDAAEIVAGCGADRVRKVINGNHASMAALKPSILGAEDRDRLWSDSLARAEEIAPLLDRRAADGLVRHCHGDLHLANICIWHGRPTPFDCLEFDDDLATSDVLYDLAFLLMDLWHRGLHAEASLVFNRYCDRRGETGGIAALPLFLAMRAAVRTHVLGSAADRQDKAAQRARLVDQAHGYLSAAHGFLMAPTPRLIAVGGRSGSGKSTLASHLAPLIGTTPGARWIRTDVLRKLLAGVDPETHLPDSAYTPAAHEAVYAALIERVRDTLAAGWPVIVDAVFDFPDTRARMEALARSLGVPFAGLWLDAEREILNDRVRGRRGDASDAGTDVVERQLARDIGSLGDWVRIDAGGTPAQTLERCRKALAALRQGDPDPDRYVKVV
ncbi:aminoglycoside phosphotransferase [Croceicoccus ponticola]|uniref:Aminoglycoside phosphotransferase n=1 Tax=Croceicoccus ponticola TaxID=2217664 RepID=A0A437H1S6_9SPHN|nr:bifunctional aminoglycoside phosphotransferase/ATP-binding protein [Croceicoccus ponticola]RVQ69588.1 aminoglycoside phosphotransferase [Croceicoccus ponticola]